MRGAVASVYRETFESVLKPARAGLPAGPLTAVETSFLDSTYFFAVTPMLTWSKMPNSKSMTVSWTPLTHGFRRYFCAV